MCENLVPACHFLAQHKYGGCYMTDVIEESSVVRLEFGDCGMSVCGCCMAPGSPPWFFAHPPLLSIASPTLFVPPTVSVLLGLFLSDFIRLYV